MSGNPRSCVIILNQDRDLLLIKRQQDGRKYWVVPGGSIEAGESAEVAAVREALEELSLVATLKNKLFTQMNECRFESYFLVDTYTGTVKLGEGPEFYRQNAKNTYEPIWVSSQEIENINLLPKNAKQALMGLLAS